MAEPVVIGLRTQHGRHIFAFAALVLFASGLPLQSASALDETYHNFYQASLPNYPLPKQVYFSQNPITYSPIHLNQRLELYFTSGGWLYGNRMRAGSGVNTNECDKATPPGDVIGGWLPAGEYYFNPFDLQHTESFRFFYKTLGSSIIQGYVWDLGAKNCVFGVPRTELFIHSQGSESPGTWDTDNYKSEGCIKISQSDRGVMAWDWIISDYGGFETFGGTLYVGGQ